ncbi:MAG: carboxypeptidase-like regulatory domain-containing protein [Saprospiraceae bacterium]|nr:carboxypeptidase-like regulatory domain-containing protein [Saprospiraceae bacterium]
MTTIKGAIIDAGTLEPLPFVNVSFKGTTIGTTTDFDGKYVLESKWATAQMEVSFIGYETQIMAIVLGERQVFDIALQSTSITMKEVVVKAKKSRYKRRDNPAVELMREVIAHKDKNRIEASNFYEMDKYEKIQFDINNFDPEELRKKRAFRKYQFILDNVDTSKVNGKPFLPFFIQESSTKVYYRKNPEDYKEHRNGVKVTGMKEYVDDKDLNDMLSVMYQSVNIYANDIRLLDLSFMSPLSTTAIGYYRFYIVDSTGTVNGTPVTKVSFYPENNQNIAFKGDLYITRGDSTFAVIRADFGITRQINVNFVQDLKLQQEFAKQPNDTWARTKDQVTVDFSILKRGTGIYGTRTATYKDFIFDKPVDDSYYVGTEKTVEAPDVYKKDEAFWQSARHEKLSDKEQNVYQMIDTIQRMPSFRRMMNAMSLVFTGYKAVGPIDIGPIANFYSFNPVEGTRVKLGGETNLKFLPKFSIGGYGAYGFKDELFKYAGFATYSFRDDFKVNPKHYVKFFYQKEVNLVGQILLLNSPDNFFLSFQRGTRDRMLLLNKIQGEYFLETPNHLSYQLTYTNTRHRKYGTTEFAYTPVGGTQQEFFDEFTTSDVGLTLRFAPNEKYIQGRTYRTQLYNKHPIFLLKLNAGLKDVLGGDYSYQSASLNVVKRFYLSFLGVTRMDFEAGKIWGNGVPYFLLNMPRANQTYTYRTTSFNMMNYQEFVSDEYALLMLEHNFNGWLFNKIPLLRKLKLREAITFKAIYGGLSDSNNPETHPEFIQFLKGETDAPATYTLQKEPYMEVGVSVGNIFKILRFDLVRRLNYLDNPEVPSLFGVKGLGIRFRAQISF